MATVFQLMELYRSVMELLKPLEWGFGGAEGLSYIRAGGLGLPDWTIYDAGTVNSLGDFGGNGGLSVLGSLGVLGGLGNLGGLGSSDGAGGLDYLSGSGSLGGLSGSGGFNFASRLSDNDGFFYTDFGGNSAVGEWGLNTVSEKIRGGGTDFHINGGNILGFIPDNGGQLGMVLGKQFVGKEISEVMGLYRGASGKWGNTKNSGEYRGLLYPFGEVVPNGRSEDFDVWKGTEHLRYTDTLNVADEVGNVEWLSDIRGYAEHESGGFGGGEVHVDMSGMRNIVNNRNDMDELIDRLCGAFTEAAFSMAEGVHY